MGDVNTDHKCSAPHQPAGNRNIDYRDLDPAPPLRGKIRKLSRQDAIVRYGKVGESYTDRYVLKPMNRLPQSALSFSAYVLGLVLLVMALSACTRSDEETAIQELIASGVKYAEAHDLGGVLDLSTDDFLAEPGNYPRNEAKRFLFVGMKRYGNFRIHHPRPSITLAENRRQASATLHFLIVNKEQLFPALETLRDDPVGWLAVVDANADLFTLAMELRVESGDWRVSRAKLTRFAGLQAN